MTGVQDSIVIHRDTPDGYMELTGYFILPGIYLALNDIHTQVIPSNKQSMPQDIFLINYCLQGRCEFQIDNDSYSYIDSRLMNIASQMVQDYFYYPSSFYVGYEIYVLPKNFSEKTKKLVKKLCSYQSIILTLQTEKKHLNSKMIKKGKHTVLFICLGNICRSPAGEGIMKSLVEKAGLSDEFEIDSAGIGNWHVGQLPDSRMRKCGAEHGYDFNSHARQFKKSDFDRFDTIVVMDNDNYHAITSMASCQADKDKVVRMADFLTHHRQYTTVPDPYYGDYSDFELVITLLEDACQGLLQSLTE